MTCLECDHPIVGYPTRGMCRKCYKTWWDRVTRHGEEWPHKRVLDVNEGKRCRHCPHRAVARGYCKHHYDKFYDAGLLELKYRRTDGPAPGDGFWEQVDRTTAERLGAR